LKEKNYLIRVSISKVKKKTVAINAVATNQEAEEDREDTRRGTYRSRLRTIRVTKKREGIRTKIRSMVMKLIRHMVGVRSIGRSIDLYIIKY
jgi:hypothetical protein